jgi:hypothetical protein
MRKGIAFERYDMEAQGGPKTDDKGIARGLSRDMGRSEVKMKKIRKSNTPDL